MRETPPYRLADTRLRDGRDGKLGICLICAARVTPRTDTGWPNSGYVQAAMHDHHCVGGHLEHDEEAA